MGDYRLLLIFNEPMASEIADPGNFTIIEPAIGHPTSAILDKDAKRLVLTFPIALLASKLTLQSRNVADITRVPLPDDLTKLTLAKTIEYPSIHHRLDSDLSGRIDFPDFLAFAKAYGSSDARFDLDENGSVNFADFITFAGLFGETVPA